MHLKITVGVIGRSRSVCVSSRPSTRHSRTPFQRPIRCLSSSRRHASDRKACTKKSAQVLRLSFSCAHPCAFVCFLSSTITAHEGQGDLHCRRGTCSESEFINIVPWS